MIVFTSCRSIPMPSATIATPLSLCPLDFLDSLKLHPCCVEGCKSDTFWIFYSHSVQEHQLESVMRVQDCTRSVRINLNTCWVIDNNDSGRSNQLLFQQMDKVSKISLNVITLRNFLILGLSGVTLTHTQSSISRLLVTSSHTLLVAVAVQAIHGVPAGINERSSARWEVESLCCCIITGEQLFQLLPYMKRIYSYYCVVPIPIYLLAYHLEIQWASSTTRATTLSEILALSKYCLHFDLTKALGVQSNRESVKKLLSVPSRSLSTPQLLELVIIQHLTSLLLRLLTWSIIRATKGLITNTVLLFAASTRPRLKSMRNGRA